MRHEVRASVLSLLTDEQRQALRVGEITISEAKGLIAVAYWRVAVGVMPAHFEAFLLREASNTRNSPDRMA